MQHVEAGLVGRKPRAHLLHAPEGAHRNPAVNFTAPRTAPVLQPEELFRGFLDERLDGILIAQPVASGNGVVGMLVEAVVRGDDTRRAPLGRDGVAAHRVHLGNNRDAEMGMGLGDGEGGAQTSSAATYEHHVVGRLHVARIIPRRTARRPSRGRRAG